MSQTPQDAPHDQPPWAAPPPYGAPPGPPAPGYAPPSSPYGQRYDAMPPPSQQEASGQVPYGQVPYGQVPYGQAPYGQAPYGQAPYGQAPYARAGYADWGSRVGALLLDAVFELPALLVVIVGVVVLSAGSSENDGGMENGAGGAGLLLVGLGYLVAFGLRLWNRVFRQGRTGQSWGKKVVGIRLVAQHTGQPVGAGLAFGREVAHVFDGFFYLGYLWPLWDEKRQTFADKVCSTVVLRAPQGR